MYRVPIYLQVMESCVKNCGVLIHDEVATKAFMEEMRELVKQTTDDNIKNKVRFMDLLDPDPLSRMNGSGFGFFPIHIKVFSELK
jgi:hypothetical protein